MVAVSARPSYSVTYDYPNLDIPRLERKRRNDLKVKTNANFRSPRRTVREKAIKKSIATAEPSTVPCKSEPWDQHDIYRRGNWNVSMFASARQNDDDFASPRARRSICYPSSSRPARFGKGRPRPRCGGASRTTGHAAAPPPSCHASCHSSARYQALRCGNDAWMRWDQAGRRRHHLDWTCVV